jgi:hypothetical protein
MKRVRLLGDDENIFLGVKLLHNKRYVARCNNVMLKPLSVPGVASLPAISMAQPLQTLYVRMTSNSIKAARSRRAPHRNIKEYRELLG